MTADSISPFNLSKSIVRHWFAPSDYSRQLETTREAYRLLSTDNMREALNMQPHDSRGSLPGDPTSVQQGCAYVSSAIGIINLSNMRCVHIETHGCPYLADSNKRLCEHCISAAKGGYACGSSMTSKQPPALYSRETRLAPVVPAPTGNLDVPSTTFLFSTTSRSYLSTFVSGLACQGLINDHDRSQ